MGKITIMDVIKDNYSKVKGNDAIMWETTQIISDFTAPLQETHKDEYWCMIKRLYSAMAGAHYNDDFAEWQVSQMFHKDKQGSIHKGQHWSMDQTNAVYEQIKGRIPATYNKCDWYVVMNMIWHDNICMYKEWFPESNEDELTNKVIHASVNWLADSDAEDGKVWNYFNK